MCGLPVSKFSLCQFASAVNKSLSSPAGASCQSVKKHAEVCVHKLNSHENLAVDLHLDPTKILISQLLIGSVKKMIQLIEL